MTPHTMVTFRLHRNGVVLLALGALLLGALLYMAGCLVGERRGRAAQAGPADPARPRLAQANAPRLPSPQAPALGPQATAASGVPPPAATRQGFTLRVGAFATADEAKALAQELAARGLQPNVSPLLTRGDTVLQTVRVGRYGSRGEAAAAASELARLLGLAAAVVAEEAPPRLPQPAPAAPAPPEPAAAPTPPASAPPPPTRTET